MKPVSNDQIAAVVADASKRMGDPNFSAELVGGFVQNQPPTVQFVSAHEPELGGAEAIVNVIFHCALLAEGLVKAGGRIRMLSFDDLDAVAAGDALEALDKLQPALASFIVSNLEHPEAKRLVALITLALARNA